MPCIASYLPSMHMEQEHAEDMLCETLQQHKVVRVEDACIKRHIEQSQAHDAEFANRRVNKFTGRQRLFKFINIVRSGLSMHPHLFQKQFFDAILPGLAPLIMGDDWQTEGVAIMQQMGWKRINKQSMASAPRRFGKTVLLAIIQIALAHCVQCKQSTFSTSQRASNGLREYVLKIIHDSNLSHILDARGQERVTIFCIDDDGRQSILMFLPANPEVRTTCTHSIPCSTLFISRTATSKLPRGTSHGKVRASLSLVQSLARPALSDNAL